MESKSGEGAEEESDEEERNEPDEPEPEVGPPLLTPVSEDQRTLFSLFMRGKKFKSVHERNSIHLCL